MSAVLSGDDRFKAPTDLPKPRRLPGDPDAKAFMDRLVRVDQAGEYGAKRIYGGQIAVLGDGPSGPVLRHMAEQEQEHLDAFNRLAAEQHVRPTALQPFWHVAGWALGAGTALMSPRAAMACTVAVETVIDEHYEKQVQALGDDHPELSAMIRKFQAEELEHRDIGLENEAELAAGYPVLSAAIKAGCRAAIWLSERV